jgi:hypothetical protein
MDARRNLVKYAAKRESWMKLSLVIPGLTWLDAHDGAEVARDLALPSLEWLLGRAAIRQAPETLSSQIAQSFGLSQLDIAQLAAKNDGLDVSTGHWLIADPVHLRIDRDRATLADIGVMRVTAEEAAELTTALNRHFVSDGLRFFAPSPGRWYLRSDAPLSVTFSALNDVIGDNIDDHRPRGAQALDWSRKLNEIQMLLFAHPVNEAREAHGDPALNSLWLWGQGDAQPSRQPARAVFCDPALLSLLARTAGTEPQAMPYSFEALCAFAPQNAWVYLDRLLAAAQYRDAWGWRETLVALETDWFAPLVAALRRREVSELILITHGPAGFHARLSHTDRWMFWRRPRALTSLY